LEGAPEKPLPFPALLLFVEKIPLGRFFTQILHEETFALYTAPLSWGL
jgi:hypothetical protein